MFTFLFFGSNRKKAREPLAVKVLNTRIHTQTFVGQILNITEETPSRITEINLPKVTQKLLSSLQINSPKNLKKLASQNPPQGALINVWVYILKFNYYFKEQHTLLLSEEVELSIKEANTKNITSIRKIASQVLSE